MSNQQSKYVFVTVLLLAMLLASVGLTELYRNMQDDKGVSGEFTIVTSFYPMYVATKNIVGDTQGVIVENLSEPQTGCLHDYQLTPADMKLLSEADVFVVNGGGIESFLTDVAQSYPELVIVNACEDIELLETENHEESHTHEEEDVHLEEEEHSQEEKHAEVDAQEEEDVHEEEDAHEHQHVHDENAHAWMSVPLYQAQLDKITASLCEIDAANATVYQQNRAEYDIQLQELLQQEKELKEIIAGQGVVSFHDAYAYLAKDLGVNIVYTLNLDEERQVSAGEVAEVTEEIKAHAVKTVWAEETYGADTGATVQRETGCEVVYLDPLTRGDGSMDSYVKAMSKNLSMLKEVYR